MPVYVHTAAGQRKAVRIVVLQGNVDDDPVVRTALRQQQKRSTYLIFGSGGLVAS